MQSLQQSLQKLNELQLNGVISSAEYEVRRQQLVDNFVGLPPAIAVSSSVPTCLPGGVVVGGPAYSPPLLRRYLGMAGMWNSRQSDKNAARAKQGSSTVKVQPVPLGTSEEALTCLFEQFGEVLSTAVKQGSPPYGYVNFVTVEAAQAAASVGKVDIGGMACSVGIAKRRRGQTVEAAASNGIGLFNLPYSTTQQELQGMLSGYEGYSAVKMVHKKTGEFRGYAFAYFDTIEHASAAKEMLTGLILGDQAVDVKFSSQSSEEAMAPLHARQAAA